MEAYALANGGKSVFQVLGSDPEAAKRFAGGAKALDHVPGCGDAFVATFYNWASLGDVRIVNVGGQRGSVAIDLANKFENLKLLVQDSAAVIDGADAAVPESLKERAKFMPHELFETQTEQADVYFFRMILRSWTDQKAIKILQAQIPALRPGAKILIQDAVLPALGSDSPLWRERLLSSTSTATTEHLDEWKALLTAADQRFVLHRVIESNESNLSILEVHWDAWELSWCELEQQSYLNAVIYEGLRLSYGMSSRLTLVPRNENLYYQNGGYQYVVPRGTAIGMSASIAHHDENVFPNSYEFVPERWIDDRGQKNKALEKYMTCFGRGTRQCLGMNLAFCELYLIVAAMVLRSISCMEIYDSKWDDIAYDYDMLTPQPKKGARALRVKITLIDVNAKAMKE
ncbi:unnamed protein product [Clonostachys rhizophaga]|uniref:O-methyltransferase C-terminal domain-containing protein n=1 Tax=Clonostachys rhizophaga TaxID=160324 RepID=A0A9N9V6T4_9HYPO|nr:unnamed protein product [Clonostachys rhizophaga]